MPEGHPLPEYVTLLIVMPVGLAIGTPVEVAVDFVVVGSSPPSPGIESVGRMLAKTIVGISSTDRSKCIFVRDLAIDRLDFVIQSLAYFDFHMNSVILPVSFYPGRRTHKQRCVVVHINTLSNYAIKLCRRLDDFGQPHSKQAHH